MLVVRSLSLVTLLATASLAIAQNAPSFALIRNTNPAYSYTEFNGVVTGDFNNDAKPDYVVAGGSSRQDVMFYAGNGDGTFQAPATVGTVTWPGIVDMAVADVNHDGKLDLIVAGNNNNASGVTTSAGGFTVFLGNGDGTFQAPLTYSTPYIPFTIAVADFNGDGAPDIAVGDYHGEIEIWNNSGGAFTPAKNVTLTSVTNAVDVRAGQFDGDGINHIAAEVGGVGTVIAWNDGKENFTVNTVDTSGSSTFAIINVGRVAQDGRDDILVSYQCAPTQASQPPPCNNAMDVVYGQGAEKTVTTRVIQNWAGSPLLPWAVDINNDGIADIVVPAGANSIEGLYAFLGKADGAFIQTPTVYAASTNGAGPAAPADFNRDGHMDFAELMAADQQSEIYLNSGPGSNCLTRSVSPSLTVCSMVDNTYNTGGVSFMAQAYDTDKVTATKLYVNGKMMAASNNGSLDEAFSLYPGTYNMVFKSWDTTGRDFVSDRFVTIDDANPGPTCYPKNGVGSASLCFPNGDSTTPLEIVGNGWTANVPTAAQLFIDGVLVLDEHPCNEEGNSCEGTSFLMTSQNLSQGQHNLLFKLWDNKGNVYEAEQSVNIID